MIEFKDFKKYRWFKSSSGKLVIGGKNASQNDELLKRIKSINNNFMVMHTSSPGSPFSVILTGVKKINKSDLEECAIFTACFSKAWKSGAKKVGVDIFKASQLYKTEEMKAGTWGVKAELELALTKQLGVLRAVPKKSVKNKKYIILKIIPGNLNKEDAIAKLALDLDEKFSQEEILSALPSGGIKIIRNK